MYIMSKSLLAITGMIIHFMICMYTYFCFCWVGFDPFLWSEYFDLNTAFVLNPK